MKLSKYGAFVFSFIASVAFGQFSEPKDNLERISGSDQYLFPIEPGTANLLAGTMGELRSNHFHSGIDIRT
ncbi:MAG: hypothetical protein RIA63_07115, partial [Cyclobacteriaceae bacterium]